MGDTIRLEEFTGLIQNKTVAVWQGSDAAAIWLPTEFLLTQYITRILVVGRAAATSVSMAADPGWTQIWRSPGAKEWSCLLGILQHMPGPVLIVVGPDVILSAKMIGALRDVTCVVMRSATGLYGWPTGADQPEHVFFPVLGDRATASLTPVVHDWLGRAVPRSLDLKTLVPQLAAQGYALTIAAGVWHWYKPADSPPLVTLTVAQVAKQLQTLGTMLEKMGA
jgi:hypothetical protein